MNNGWETEITLMTHALDIMLNGVEASLYLHCSCDEVIRLPEKTPLLAAVVFAAQQHWEKVHGRDRVAS